MINTKKKIAAFALTLFFAAGTATVYAQVPQTPAQQPMQSPTMNQNRPSPQQQLPQQQPPMEQHQDMPMDQTQNQSPDFSPDQTQANAKVSDKELKEFASVYPKVQEESQKAQQQMASVIEKDGMKLDRFNEIQTAKIQNQKTDASKEEMETFNKITGELDAMQPTIQKNIESVITSSGLSIERFQAIASAIQADPHLQSRFQKIMSGKI